MLLWSLLWPSPGQKLCAVEHWELGSRDLTLHQSPHRISLWSEGLGKAGAVTDVPPGCLHHPGRIFSSTEPRRMGFPVFTGYQIHPKELFHSRMPGDGSCHTAPEPTRIAPLQHKAWGRRSVVLASPPRSFLWSSWDGGKDNFVQLPARYSSSAACCRTEQNRFLF